MFLSFLFSSYFSLMFPTALLLHNTCCFLLPTSSNFCLPLSVLSLHVLPYSVCFPLTFYIYLSLSVSFLLLSVILILPIHPLLIFSTTSATPSNAFIPLTLFVSHLLPTFMSSSSRLYQIFFKIHLPQPYFVSSLHHLLLSTLFSFLSSYLLPFILPPPYPTVGVAVIMDEPFF